MHIYAHIENILMYNHVTSSIYIQGQGREQEGVGERVGEYRYRDGV